MTKDLRNKLIRLAHQKPELRKDLIPLLKEAKTSAIHGGVGGSPTKGSIAEFVEKWFTKFAKDLKRAYRGVIIVSVSSSMVKFELPLGTAPNLPKWKPHFKLVLDGGLKMTRWTGKGDKEIEWFSAKMSSDKIIPIVVDAMDKEIERLKAFQVP